MTAVNNNLIDLVTNKTTKSPMSNEENGKPTTFINLTIPDENKPHKEKLPVRFQVYSREQKIVTAVWFHERKYTGLQYEDIRTNFEIRFKGTAPSLQSIINWEKKLFSKGIAYRSRKRRTASFQRLVHVPYVLESLKLDPNLTIAARARKLGLPSVTLRRILSTDLKDLPENFHLLV